MKKKRLLQEWNTGGDSQFKGNAVSKDHLSGVMYEVRPLIKGRR